MILPCTSPPDTPFTQIWKAREVAGLNGRAAARPTVLAGDKERRPMWPDPAGRRKKNGQMKKNVRCVNIRACSRSRP